MKTRKIIYICLLSAVSLLTSCSPVIYSNVGQNTPMFETKGEIMVSMGYSETSGEVDLGLNPITGAKGISIQSAYAIDSSWALIGSFYSLKSMAEPEEDLWKGKGSYFELGGGKFGNIISEKLGYEIFGGVGFGSIKNDLVGNPDFVNVNFVKPFIQPSAGFLTKYFDIILTPRFGIVTFNSNEFSLDDLDNSDQAEIFFRNHKNTFVFEPGVTLRGGYKAIKAQFQYVFSTFKTDPEFQNLGINYDYVSLGIYFLISDRY